MLFKNLEDMFYKFLKQDREFDNPRWPFLIKVRDVEGKVMIDATFKKRAKSQGQQRHLQRRRSRRSAPSCTSTSTQKMVRVHLDQAEVQNYGKEDDVCSSNNNILEIPIPQREPVHHGEGGPGMHQREIDAELAKAREQIATDRKRQAIRSASSSPPARFDDGQLGRGPAGRSSTTATGRSDATSSRPRSSCGCRWPSAASSS